MNQKRKKKGVIRQNRGLPLNGKGGGGGRDSAVTEGNIPPSELEPNGGAGETFKKRKKKNTGPKCYPKEAGGGRSKCTLFLQVKSQRKKQTEGGGRETGGDSDHTPGGKKNPWGGGAAPGGRGGEW